MKLFKTYFDFTQVFDYACNAVWFIFNFWIKHQLNFRLNFRLCETMCFLFARKFNAMRVLKTQSYTFWRPLSARKLVGKWWVSSENQSYYPGPLPIVIFAWLWNHSSWTNFRKMRRKCEMSSVTVCRYLFGIVTWNNRVMRFCRYSF